MPRPNLYQSLHTSRDSFRASRSKCRFARRKCTASPSRASPLTGNIRAARRSGFLGRRSAHRLDAPLDRVGAGNAGAQRVSLDSARGSLSRRRCTRSLRKGRVVVLPRGATPVDFAYAVHTEVGHQCAGAKVNGEMVPLRHALANGDVVEIVTQKGPHAIARLARFRPHFARPQQNSPVDSICMNARKPPMLAARFWKRKRAKRASA